MRGLCAVSAILIVAACGGPQDQGNAGAKCYRDDDCAYGLVCAVPAGRAERVCTDDVSGLVSEVEPPVGGAPGAGGGAQAGAVGAGGTVTTAGSGGASAGRPNGGGAGAPP